MDGLQCQILILGKKQFIKLHMFLLFISINNMPQHGGVPYHLKDKLSVHPTLLNVCMFVYMPMEYISYVPNDLSFESKIWFVVR